MARFSTVLKQFNEAAKNKDLPAMEAVYLITDHKIGDIDKEEDLGMKTSPAAAQRWNVLHGDVCTILNRLRKIK